MDRFRIRILMRYIVFSAAISVVGEKILGVKKKRKEKHYLSLPPKKLEDQWYKYR